MSKAEETAADDGESATKSGKKKLLLLVLAVVAAAAAGAWFFVLPLGEATAEEAPVPGAVLALEPVAVNLAGGGYLKVGIALQLTEEAGAAEEELDGTKASDLIIAHFSQAQPADVTGAREALNEALGQRIIEAYEGAVMDIYYIEYVTQ